MNRTTRTALAVTATAALAVGGALLLAGRPDPVDDSRAAPDAAGDQAGPGARRTGAGETGHHPDRPDVDHDGDGKGDLVTSAANARVGDEESAGLIVALRGTANGLSGERSTVVDQDSPGVPGTAEADDRFGAATASGDFDGDGIPDLAVGSPGEDRHGRADAGTVTILWGTSSGLTGIGAVRLEAPAPRGGDRLGSHLTAGDFDGDGQEDLAAASKYSTVHVWEGGITRTGATGGHRTRSVPGEWGPTALHSGDFTGDGAADIVVGVRALRSDGDGNRLPSRDANVLLVGGAAGPRLDRTQDVPPGVAKAVGDLDRDGCDDLVVGYTDDEEADGTVPEKGARGGKVWITYGSPTGFAPSRATGITRGAPGVPPTSAGDNAFGGGLALGDVDADGRLDLAIGIPGDNIDGIWDTGAVVLLHGTADGIGTAGARYLHQETAGVPGSHQGGDRLGEDLRLDDVTGDGRADLIAAVPGEDGVGGILYLPADGTGAITTAGARVISPASVGVPARPTDRHDSYLWAPGFAERFAD
ncbi:FG-GAP-like repeat-containing protein [Streptomyces sp. NPDC056600]|uniref:FG-GAP-like repeat-containing protein n=1 Tax=Streptomyces sp. NPDC056600 TaxID=3345874 RepID=UPI0036801220